MKVAFVGTHGVGKTTLCFETAARLKRSGYNVEIVMEVARRCPLPINEQTTLGAQEWILLAQRLREIELGRTCDILLCDRAVLDNYCYMVASFGRQEQWELLLRDWLTSYEVIMYVPPVVEVHWDGVRSTDPRFRKKVDKILMELIEEWEVPVKMLGSDPNTWADRAFNIVVERLEQTQPLLPGMDAH